MTLTPELESTRRPAAKVFVAPVKTRLRMVPLETPFTRVWPRTVAVSPEYEVIVSPDFATVNEVYGEHLEEPYPARACVQVAALPRGVDIEVEAILAV